jgi:hypothetical protein
VGDLFNRYDQLYWDGTMAPCQIELADFDPHGMRTRSEAEAAENRLLTCGEDYDHDAEARDCLLHSMARMVAGFEKKKRGGFSELDRKWHSQA